MVYNGTYVGLNTLLCDTSFVMPTFWSNLWEVERGAYMVEREIGQMFLNFILSEEVR